MNDNFTQEDIANLMRLRRLGALTQAQVTNIAFVLSYNWKGEENSQIQMPQPITSAYDKRVMALFKDEGVWETEMQSLAPKLPEGEEVSMKLPEHEELESLPHAELLEVAKRQKFVMEKMYNMIEDTADKHMQIFNLCRKQKGRIIKETEENFRIMVLLLDVVNYIRGNLQLLESGQQMTEEESLVHTAGIFENLLRIRQLNPFKKDHEWRSPIGS